jgi:hypothetical protein
MQNDTALLDTPIVAPAEGPTGMHENGADRDAAFREALPGFLESRLEKLIHIEDLSAATGTKHSAAGRYLVRVQLGNAI